MSLSSRLHDVALAAATHPGDIREALEDAADAHRPATTDELPRGRVDCERPGECFCEGRRYTCQSCLRFVPECFGAADEYGDVCDDCAALIARTEQRTLREAETEPPSPLSPLVEMLMGLDFNRARRRAVELDLHPLSGASLPEQP